MFKETFHDHLNNLLNTDQGFLLGAAPSGSSVTFKSWSISKPFIFIRLNDDIEGVNVRRFWLLEVFVLNLGNKNITSF